jgi:multidrug resistance efflux pump
MAALKSNGDQAQQAATVTIQPKMSVTPPRAPTDSVAASLQLLLQIERDIRRATTTEELGFCIVNELRKAVGARQCYILDVRDRKMVLQAVSSLSAIDRSAPLVRWIEGRLKALQTGRPFPGALRLNIKDGEKFDDAMNAFPFPEGMITALKGLDGRDRAWVLSVRETPFLEGDGMLQQRLTDTCSHAWNALEGRKRAMRFVLRKPIIAASLIALSALLMTLPVPMTALAPAEVVPMDPAVISAPMDGSVEKVMVDPNQSVKVGDILFQYVDTQTRGALEIAERDVSVAEARLKQATQMAFVDPLAKRDLAVARSELHLKKAEFTYARDMHERTVVRAPRDGITVFADKRDWMGRPVQTGQRIMEIADPAKTQFRLQIPADDALIANAGAKVRIFMDSDPLSPLSAELIQAAPLAKPTDSGAIAFRAEARLPGEAAMPPLGHRGTAQITGDNVSLGFYLFRRPLAALRQKTGF